MNEITITKASAYKEGECNCCKPYKEPSKRDKIYSVHFAFNPRQGTVIRLCPKHLLDLADEIDLALNPMPTKKEKK